MIGGLNSSQRDEQSFAKSYEEITIYETLTYFTFVTDIIKLILCLSVVAVDIFLITTISSFKEIQTKTNAFVKHYAIFNLSHMVATPMLWFFLERTSLSTYLRSDVYCTIMQVEASSILFCHLFSFGLALYWLLSSHQETLESGLKWIHEHLIRIIYAVGIVLFVIQNVLCFTLYWRIRYTIGHTVYIVILIFLGICDYVEYNDKVSKDRDASFALSVASIMIFCWGPLYLYKELLDLTQGTVILRYILLFTLFIPEWLAYGCPIIVLILLQGVNTPFKAVCWNFFKKSRGTHNKKDQGLKESETEVSDQKYHLAYDNTTYL